jgi:hypothetical protein
LGRGEDMEVISVKREKCWRQNEEEEEKNA